VIDDQISDEELVKASQTGDRQSEETLVRRYYDRIGFFLLKNTWHKNLDNLEDVRQIIFFRAVEMLRAKRFIPEGPNTFRDWLYTLARNISHQEEYKYAKLPKPIGKQLLDIIPSDIESTRPIEDIEQSAEELNEKIEQLLNNLSDEERNLLQLFNDNKSYKEIHETEPFKKYTLPNLRRKICDIRKFVYEEVAKWQKIRKT
jgi:RNA polymerase sigma factor (sigma-70 family)